MNHSRENRRDVPRLADFSCEAGTFQCRFPNLVTSPSPCLLQKQSILETPVKSTIIASLLLVALVGCGPLEPGESGDVGDVGGEELETSTAALDYSSCTVTLRSCTTSSYGVSPSCNHRLNISVRGGALTTYYKIYDVRNGVQVASGSVGSFGSTFRQLSGVYSRYKGRIDGSPTAKITVSAPIVICN